MSPCWLAYAPIRMRLRSALALLIAVLVLSGCGDSAADVAAARERAKTVNGICPVREELVVPRNFSEYQGLKIGFCCPPCKADFEEEPEEFMAKMRADRDKFGYVGP